MPSATQLANEQVDKLPESSDTFKSSLWKVNERSTADLKFTMQPLLAVVLAISGLLSSLAWALNRSPVPGDPEDMALLDYYVLEETNRVREKYRLFPFRDEPVLKMVARNFGRTAWKYAHIDSYGRNETQRIRAHGVRGNPL